MEEVHIGWAQTHGGEGPIGQVSSLVILCSVILHGLTATPLTRWAASRIEKNGDLEARSGETVHMT